MATSPKNFRDREPIKPKVKTPSTAGITPPTQTPDPATGIPEDPKNPTIAPTRKNKLIIARTALITAFILGVIVTLIAVWIFS